MFSFKIDDESKAILTPTVIINDYKSLTDSNWNFSQRKKTTLYLDFLPVCHQTNQTCAHTLAMSLNHDYMHFPNGTKKNTSTKRHY